MAKHRNLTKDDLEDVSIYEEVNHSKNGVNKLTLSNIQIHVKCLNEKQKELKKSIEDSQITICFGAAGTGKTFMSLLTALHLLKTKPKYSKLVLIKSLQVIKGEEIGFLKGELESKIYPYMYSFTTNLDKIFKSTNITKSLIEQNIIEFFPITFCRGVNFDEQIVIIDEIQNLTMHSFKTLITRIGYNAKMIFLGDEEQSDLKKPEESCIKKVIESLSNNQHVKIIKFDDSETVRNPIIKDLLRDINNVNC